MNLAERKTRTGPWLVFLVLALLGTALRLISATHGYNNDIESFSYVAHQVQLGKSIYIHAYQYGPPGGLMMGILRSFAEVCGFAGIQGFHLFMAGFLSIIDVIIAYLVLRISGIAGAAFFLLNPVS